MRSFEFQFTKLRIFFLSLLISVVSLNASVHESHANGVCLSEIPDSAWAEGQPKDLNLQGISTRTLLTGPELDFSLYERLPIKIKYEYLGSSCSLRTVVISKVINPNITEITIDEYFKLYEKSSTNLFVAREQLTKFNESIEKINKIEGTLRVSKLTDGVLVWNESSRVFSGIAFDLATNSRFSGVRSVPTIEFDSKCTELKSIEDGTEYRNFRKYFYFGPYLFNAANAKVPPFKISMKSSSCPAKISILLGSFLTSGTINGTVSLDPLNYPLYKIAVKEIIIDLNRIELKPTTILCSKGKSKKSITGVKPVCPKGYVKK